jgi:hypothetical protein
MPEEQKRIRIDLTTEQQAFVKERTGIEVPSVELTAEELEQRIAPTSFSHSYQPQKPDGSL